jgi:hypothetical protein
MSKIKFNLTCHPIFVPFYGPDTGTVIARTVQNQQKDFKHVYNYPKIRHLLGSLKFWPRNCQRSSISSQQGQW